MIEFTIATAVLQATNGSKMDGWMEGNGWMDGWMPRWLDGWTQYKNTRGRRNGVSLPYKVNDVHVAIQSPNDQITKAITSPRR